ncbi:MAG: SUMF1/EgtB/PvdO family nonheme iron enzyme [Anaerolineales bacterium]|nr:SUMF1/EgtB/PvdO family nonheme iron enzyme [Anaerolineales bacterium]
MKPSEIQAKIETLQQQLDVLKSGDAQEIVLQTLLEKIADLQTQLTALGDRSMAIGGDVDHSILNTGDDNTIVRAENYIEKQIVGGEEPGDPAALRTAYLNRILESTSQLSLTGIDRKAASEAEARLSLSAVYTALLTLSPASIEHLTREEYREQGDRFLSALEQLNQHHRLVLLGDPGSGKSTFVNFAALCLAGENLGHSTVNLNLLTTPLPPDENQRREKDEEPQPQPWDHGALLPVRVILRDFAARGLPPVGETATAKHLWDFIATELAAANLESYEKHLVKELLKTGGLLLLDGLDEVPAAQQRRAQIKQAVEDFAATFGKCRILVTSRTYAYQKQDWRLNGFKETILAPFNKGQIRQFVEHWYAHIAVLRDLQRDDAQGRAELLKNAIFSSDRLRGLAERPLLLTLMSSLHAWRGGSLPEKREELYADTVDLLLDWWESPKVVRDGQGTEIIRQPSLAEWLKIDRDRVRELLNHLAYQAHANQPDLTGTADVSEGDLVGGLMRLSQNPDVNPARLVEYISQRAGLLVSRGVGVYTFPHRTFQEYLAACYLTDHDYPDRVADLARKDPNRWREVALLAGAKAARGTSAAIWLLVEGLCYRELEGETNPEDEWGAHLAGQALLENAVCQDVSERNQPKEDRVCTWLTAIVQRGLLPPTERAAAGVTLAHLGDERPEIMRLDAMPFCYIPAGPFRMGEGESEKEVDLPDYWMAQYPVSNAQYAAFMAAGGYAEKRFWPEAQKDDIWQDGKIKGSYENEAEDTPWIFGEPFNLSNHPVVGISWYEALAFTRWLTEKWHTADSLPHGWSVALPSEAQWEKAARGGLQIPAESLIHIASSEVLSAMPGLEMINKMPARDYPWGEEFDPAKANTRETGLGTTSVLGCFPAGMSPYGVLDLSGNIWEWNMDWYDDDKDPRVVRGGSWIYTGWDARCAYRNRNNPDDRDYNIGFRVILSLANSES